ncbi:limbic system-associated membrane protein-like [Physella acuta]|uniref:limbic system-associated membrane protein-like n=1 Tax=Physella acuta TaxID=109671 RepID=UPI0027DD181E|nr:limbic system-associated membrane protein-like [Physella acuta]
MLTCMESWSQPWSRMFYLLSPVLLLLTQVVSHQSDTVKPVHVSVASKNVTVVTGSTAVLPCSVDFLGHYKVVWMLDKKVYTLEEKRIITDDRVSLERPYTKEWNLHIRKVEPNDSGTYHCQINTNPIQVRPVQLIVHEPPKIIDHLSTPTKVFVREGDTVELVCNVTGIPAPTVTWHRVKSEHRHGDEDRGSKPNLGNPGEVLVIHNVSRYCDDKYECVAFNGVDPVAVREIDVNVQFAPEVRLPNKKIGQVRGKQTILECDITAVPHQYNVWRRYGRDISRNPRYTTEVFPEDEKVTITLKVVPLADEDYGEYECFASNSLGNDSETMILHELPKPDSKTTTTPRPTWGENLEERSNQEHYSETHSWGSNNQGKDRQPNHRKDGGDNPTFDVKDSKIGSVISDPQDDGYNTAVSVKPWNAWTAVTMVITALLLCTR